MSKKLQGQTLKVIKDMMEDLARESAKELEASKEAREDGRMDEAQTHQEYSVDSQIEFYAMRRVKMRLEKLYREI